MAISNPNAQPPATSPGRRVLTYLGSTRNIAGCLLALIGLLLHFIGLVGSLWPFVVVALYLIGVLVIPAPRRVGVVEGLDPREIRRALDRAVRMGQGRLPADVQARIVEIRQEILDVIPSTSQFPTGSEDLYVIQRTATDYLPSTLQAYLALPQAYATSHVVQDGKTPLQLLRDQLQLLDEKLEEITDAVHRRDSDRLVANGRFLEERFGRGPAGGLTLPPDV